MIMLSIAILRPGYFHHDFLMPTVHTADGIGVDRKGEILMYARVLPDAIRTGIGAAKRGNAFHLAQPPLPGLHLLQICQRRRSSIAPGIFRQTPAPQMVRAGHNAGPNRFRHPHADDEIANLGSHFSQRRLPSLK